MQSAFVLHLSPLLLDATRYALLSTRLRGLYGHDEESVIRLVRGFAGGR